MEESQRGPTLNKEIREYFKNFEQMPGTSTWQLLREIPTGSEILRAIGTEEIEGSNDAISATENFELPCNRIVGKWRSKEEYLGAHYELLREDVIGPFRDAVEDFRNKALEKENESYCVYDKTYIKGFTFSPQGIAARVSFSYRRAGKRIVWEQSKRLIPGSLVALSPNIDSFQTICIVAVVAARSLDKVKQAPPEIDLYFSTPEDTFFDPQQEWVMVEAKTGYFEATRHTLVALQKLMSESFPLSEHLIRLKTNIAAPRYLQEDPLVDIFPAYPQELVNGEIAKIDLTNAWPQPSSNSSLDDSQISALQQILTKRLAIIQGPPGTGKTHVSVIALRILLNSWKFGDPPILVSAQTNHALDQLLLHVSQFEGNFIRLGGQTADTYVIKKRTLYEVRRASPNNRDPPGCLRGTAFNKLRKLTKWFVNIFMSFQDHKAPLSADFFLDLGLLDATQYKNLVEGANQFVQLGGDQEKSSPIALWLGDALEPFFVKYENESSFGFDEEEEEDLEFEQLKELEAEQGLADEEDHDFLKGQYIPVMEPFIAHGHRVSPTMIEMYSKYADLWMVPAQARGRIYSHLQEKAKQRLLREIRAKAREYAAATRELKIGKWERDATVLETTKLIGMTTTGFSKYRPLISSLKPQVVLIEEAAEIVEAPVAVACVESLQHLILVGDHKQLQGSCTQKDLEGHPFYLNVSMFERLVNNGIPYKALTKQRRMNPEIRRLLTPIYGELEDHEVVKTRENIPGMGGTNSFFFTHSWRETIDDYLSKCNNSEAEMIAGFFSYLFLNGVGADQITVLTFYNGQRKKILTKLRRQPHLTGCYFNVKTVDSYQGEENEVVILSLVRNNARGNIGFLAISNRVCVALSRAKRGFYIFGNATLLSSSSRLWWEVLNIMNNDPARVGSELPMVCQNHERQMGIDDPSQWDKLTAGCDLACTENLHCGHQCPMSCHPFPHKSINCPQRCERIVPCPFNHQCIEHCHVRPCRCECFSQDLDSDNQPVLNGVEHVQRELLQIEGTGLYDGPAGPPLAVLGPCPYQSRRSRAEDSHARDRIPAQDKRDRSEQSSPQSGSARSPLAWQAYANGGHIEHDLQLFAEAERRRHEAQPQYQEQLRNHVAEHHEQASRDHSLGVENPHRGTGHQTVPNRLKNANLVGNRGLSSISVTEGATHMEPEMNLIVFD